VSTKGRLTRQELGWLLTQEAANAADRLRSGVQVLRTNAPPPSDEAPPLPEIPVEASLDALDDVMKMLTSLHAKPSSGRGRRGRIDLASLLWEVAPDARVSMEPGSGTEVNGDEGELRRMLHVVLGHGTGAGSNVTIKREGEEVRLAVVLGPDSSAMADTERAWLSRMAIRYGGRHELEGGTESLVFPADGAYEKKEREALRKELDEARKQGEAYARELAQVFAAGEDTASPSTFPPSPGRDRFPIVAQLAGAMASEMRTLLFPIVRDLKGSRPSDETLDGVRRRLMHVQDFLVGLAGIGELDPNELPIEVDFCDVSRQATRALAPRADRGGITLKLVTLPDGPDLRAYGRCAPRSANALIRELVAQALAATPHDGAVTVTVTAAGHGEGENLGTRVTVDDGGAPLPATARRAFLALELDPGTYGRPSSLPLYICSEIASAQGALLELADGPNGGLRVTVTFPK
jgi:two-component system, OmpR family, sensor kinase